METTICPLCGQKVNLVDVIHVGKSLKEGTIRKGMAFVYHTDVDGRKCEGSYRSTER